MIAYTREEPAGIPPELELDDEVEEVELLDDELELEELELLLEVVEELVDDELLEELDDELLGSVPPQAVSVVVSTKPKKILCQLMALIPRIVLAVKCAFTFIASIIESIICLLPVSAA